MIISIRCCDSTKTLVDHIKVEQQLLTLSQYKPSITRAQVIFSKNNYHDKSDDVTCRLFVHLLDVHPINITEHQTNEMYAFKCAIARLIHELTQHTVLKQNQYAFNNASETLQ